MVVSIFSHRDIVSVSYYMHVPFPNLLPVFVFGYDPPNLPVALAPPHATLPRLQASPIFILSPLLM